MYSFLPLTSKKYYNPVKMTKIIYFIIHIFYTMSIFFLFMCSDFSI